MRRYNLSIRKLTHVDRIIHQNIINPLASPGAGAPALKYGDVNTVTPSPGEVKGLMKLQNSI